MRGAAALLDVNYLLQVDPVGVVYVAVGVAHGHYLAAQLRGLLGRVGRDVAAAGDNYRLTGEAVVLHALERFLREVAQAVAGGLGSGQRAAEGDALAGYRAALEGAGDALVLAEQVADLARAHADVAGRYVRELADVLVQLVHKALAEAHDLAVALALGVKVAAALAAAHGQRGQAVLERLLKAEELDDRGGHAGVEAQAALVGADRAVELDAETAVDADLAVVVNPGDGKLYETLGLDKTLHNAVGFVLGMLLNHTL